MAYLHHRVSSIHGELTGALWVTRILEAPRVAECGKLELKTLSNSRASLSHATHIPCGPLACKYE